MKKYLFISFLGLSAVLIMAPNVFAATTISFLPAAVNIKTEQTFNLSVAVDPQGIKNYTVKLKINYPADLLEIKSFSFGSNWMALSQPGYDLIDNTNGVLIKSAGYPGGLSSSATFGTISFSAKKAGSGTIKTDTGSLAIDANSQNVLSGTPEVSVIVTVPASVPVVPSAPKAPTVPSLPPETNETPAAPEEQPLITEQPAEQPIAQQAPASQTSLLAAIGNILTLGTNNKWIGILVIVVILGIIYAICYCFKKKK